MADLLLGVSQLLDQTVQPGWEPDPDLATLVSPVMHRSMAAETLVPTVDEPVHNGTTPQFVANATRSSLQQEKLQRLLETATLPEEVSLARLLASASNAGTGQTRQLTDQPTAPSPESSGAAASYSFEIATAPRPLAAPTLDDLQGLDRMGWTGFDFSEVATAAESIPAPKPSFTSPQLATTLSFVSTPQALAMARQQVQAPQGPRPSSGGQLYGQRQAALQSGKLYTRMTPDSFYDQWVNPPAQPTYEQWKRLLAQEANAIAKGQGQNRLTVVVGDSLSLWLPTDMLPQDRFWLNQGISGDTTQGILNRLSAFAETRPDTIHVMAGVNDLKNGASNAEILGNLQRIMEQLRQQHPQARIIVHSILPTRLASIPSTRIRALNNEIAIVAQRQQVVYLDLGPSFTDEIGNLRYELTTDGIHLSRLGYQVWQIAMLAV
jgi:lysophospholipase L1-like esterase